VGALRAQVRVRLGDRDHRFAEVVEHCTEDDHGGELVAQVHFFDELFA
jgi:hypothetical protein